MLPRVESNFHKLLGASVLHLLQQRVPDLYKALLQPRCVFYNSVDHILLTRVPPRGRMRACFVVFPMNAIEMPLTYRFIPTSSANLRSWCPQIAATATQKLPGFSRSAQHSTDSLLASVTLTKQQQFHTVCKISLALAQYIILTKNYPTNERNLKAKFTVCALSFGLFSLSSRLGAKTT